MDAWNKDIQSYGFKLIFKQKYIHQFMDKNLRRLYPLEKTYFQNNPSEIRDFTDVDYVINFILESLF